MSKENAGTQSNKTLKIILTVLLIIIICAGIYYIYSTQEQTGGPPLSLDGAVQMQVVVIDVGQGDSILVVFDTGETMLIDAGTKSSAKKISNILDTYGIEKIDVLVATHPHADHIGGMESIVKEYQIGRIYMPDKPSSSATYKNLVSAVEENDIPVVEAYAGLDFILGPATCTIVSPQKDIKSDANNASVVIFLDYGETDFLFTGDMETKAENIVLDEGYLIDAEVLKVAHHGSSSSTSEDFLIAVSPDYAVISCGQGNSYNHPHEQTLELLSLYNIELYRTDIVGDVVFTADGRNIKVSHD